MLLGGGDLAAIREEFSYKQNVEVVIQHRLRMYVWTPSERTREEQLEFKASLISFYECQHDSNPDLLKCMVSGDFFRRENVVASHVWKFCTHGAGLNEFGLEIEDISNPQNGILICKEIEIAFDTKH